MRRTAHAPAALTAALLVAALSACAPLSAPTPAAATSEAASPVAPVATASAAMPTIAAMAVPATCDELYSADFRAGLEAAGFALNPADKDLTQYKDIGSEDGQLIAMIEGAPDRLTCHWLAAVGASSEAGLATNVLAVPEAVSTAAMARMEEMNFSKTASSGGIRFSYEEHTENGDFGESHLFREGLWLATAWTNFGPDGYTADMATSIFGA